MTHKSQITVVSLGPGPREYLTLGVLDALKKAEQVIADLYARGVYYYGCGGDIGFDTLMAQTCFELQESGSFPLMRVILVYPFYRFNDNWNSYEKQIFLELHQKYDKEVCISEVPCREAYYARNRHLVDGSAYCISYCVEQNSGSGYTVRYAQNKGLEIIDLATV